MVKTWTHEFDNTHVIDIDSWYTIGSPESHMYERAECYPYAGFSSNRPTGPIQSSSCDVRVSVSVSVCLFDVSFHVVYFEAYFAPTSRNRISKIWNPWGKVLERSGLRIEHFLVGCGLKSPRKKKFFC